MLRVIVFNVQHGFCAFVKSGTGCTLLIDLGESDDFSPVDYILKYELSDTVPHNGYRLTKLIVTHPHDDHIDSIADLKAKLPPAILRAQQNYNWEFIKAPGAQPGEYENLDIYAEWQANYSVPVTVEPNWGMQIRTFCLTPSEAYALNKTTYVNNSSIVTVISVKGTVFSEKFVFGGDVEQEGWEALLKKDDFRYAVSGADFFIAPHHGHTSGFSTALYDAMGKPFLNLLSAHSRDPHVDDRYSSKDFARGAMVGGVQRYMLSTRTDGSIVVEVDSEGRFAVYPETS